MISLSTAPDPNTRAKLDGRAIELLAGVRDRFRAYGAELGAQEWAPYYIGEVPRFVSNFDTMVNGLVHAHVEHGYSEDRLCPAVFACIAAAVKLDLLDGSRGTDYHSRPLLPATYPWMASELFDKDEFRRALKEAIARACAENGKQLPDTKVAESDRAAEPTDTPVVGNPAQVAAEVERTDVADVDVNISGPSMNATSREVESGPREEFAPARFSAQYRTRFLELRKTGELHATNRHVDRLDFGPWAVGGDQRDSETKARLKIRFRAAVRAAAVAAGAPARANLQDWWICRLARGQSLPYIQGLLQRSAEYCEELESNAAELKPLVDDLKSTLGLSRDRYSCDHPVPYWLYTEPHRIEPDPRAEFAYWEKVVWNGFNDAVEYIARLPRLRRKRTDENANPNIESKENFRRRVAERVANRTTILDALILGLSYDLAVLQANYTVDRGFPTEVAIRTFGEDAEAIIDKVRLAWQAAARRWGLSWRKQEKRLIGMAKPFHEVSADLSTLLAEHRPKVGQATLPQPHTSGRPELPVLILRDKLNRELVSPEDALKELGVIADDARNPRDLRANILDWLNRLFDPPTDVEDPTSDTLREKFRQTSPTVRREGMKILISRILEPPAIKDYEASKRNAQRMSQLGLNPGTGQDENVSKPAANDQTIAVGSVPSNRSFGPPAVHIDPTFPPADIWQEASALVKDAVSAWGFKGPEPEHFFWLDWMKRCGWRDETDFLSASIDHCKKFAGQLLGMGRETDAGVFARVAVGLERLKQKADARVSDLLSEHAGPRAKIPSDEETAAEGKAATARARAVRRQQVVMRILSDRQWTRGKLVTESGVGKGTVYEYLHGTREWISFDNGKAIADALGIAVTDLPDVKAHD